MKQIWIEDFLALAELSSFSRAARQRNVTQPAFSRRIRQLEDWLGVDLVNRSSQPVRLTTVAQRYVPEFRALLHDMTRLRSRMSAEHAGAIRLVLTTQHSLTITRLPTLLHHLDNHSGLKVDFNVHSANRDECVALFFRGHADLLLCMEEDDDPVLHGVPGAQRLQLGTEVLVPITAPDSHGRPLFGARGSQRLKVLTFPSDSYLGRVMSVLMSTLMTDYMVEVVHESVFLAGVMEMVKVGLGMAWLPRSLVDADIKRGELIDLSPRFPVKALQLGLYRHAETLYPDVFETIFSLLKQQERLLFD